MQHKLVCIVQARRRSTRLPDKILQPLGEKAALWHVLKRCKAIPSVHEVMCAGIDDPYEKPIFDIANEAGCSTFRGSEKNVLARYYYAAKDAGAEWVMRVTSDCPLFDPDVAEGLVQKTLALGADFGGNSNWPHGLDCEVFPFWLLEKAYKNATTDGEKEHVTLWMKRQKDIKIIIHSPPDGKNYHSLHRWVLDYPEDYDFLKSLYEKLGPKVLETRWRSIIKLLEKQPSLPDINRHCADLWTEKNTEILKS